MEREKGGEGEEVMVGSKGEGKGMERSRGQVGGGGPGERRSGEGGREEE